MPNPAATECGLSPAARHDREVRCRAAPLSLTIALQQVEQGDLTSAPITKPTTIQSPNPEDSHPAGAFLDVASANHHHRWHSRMDPATLRQDGPRQGPDPGYFRAMLCLIDSRDRNVTPAHNIRSPAPRCHQQPQRSCHPASGHHSPGRIILKLSSGRVSNLPLFIESIGAMRRDSWHPPTPRPLLFDHTTARSWLQT